MKKILISTLVSALIISCSSTSTSVASNVVNDKSGQIVNGLTAGSTVLGVTQTGVDLTESNNPDNADPLLIVITDGKNKGCSIVSTAYADMKSNRIYGKLERLSCASSDKVIDKSIEGFIAGDDGKNGVLGVIGNSQSGKKILSLNEGTKLSIVFTNSVTY